MEAPAAKGATSEYGAAVCSREPLQHHPVSPGVPASKERKSPAARVAEEDEEDDEDEAEEEAEAEDEAEDEAEEEEEPAEAHSSGTSSRGKRSASDLDGSSSPSSTSEEPSAKRARSSSGGTSVSSDASEETLQERRLKAAYNDYLAKGYVVHSLDIESILKNGIEKKKPCYYSGVRWSKDNSKFVPCANSLQIDCGRSRLFVLDVELSALAAWGAIEAEAGGPFDTFTVCSGGGGLHLYFRAFEDAQLNRSFAKQFKLDGEALDIDVRAEGGCIFAPPSSYTSVFGVLRKYVVEKDVPVAEMPPALKAKLKAMLQAPGRARGPPGAGAARLPPAGGAPTAAPAAAPAPHVTGAALTLNESAVVLRDAAAAADVLSRLAAGPAEAWDSHDTTIRIAFALSSISRGTDLLLDAFIQLARTSPKAEEDVAAWATKLYRTPPPAGGGPRPGLPFLRKLIPMEAAEEELRTKITVIFNQAHKEQEALAHITAAHKERLTSALAALALSDEPDTEFELAMYLAELANSRYRYYKDPTVKDQATLLYSDGVLFKEEAFDEAFVFAQHLLLDVLARSVALCREEMEKDAALDFSKAVKYLSTLRVRLSGAFFNAVVQHACRELKSKSFYLNRGLDTPADFYQKLDSNVHVTAFNNGVYDFRSRKFYRPGAIPADAIGCFSAGYDYLGDEDGLPASPADAAMMDEVERELIDKTFPDAETRAAAKVALGCTLIGGSGLVKKFFIALGADGNNGKSALFNWAMKAALGDHFYTLSTAHATGAHDAVDGCSPALVLAMRRKMVVINEGPKDKAMNAAFIKMMTGGDDLAVRGLYGKPVPEPFLAKLWLLSNHAPVCLGSDPVFQKRLFPISFDAVFDDKLAADDPAAGKWRARPEPEMRAYYKRAAPYTALLLIRWCKEFLDNGSKLLQPPAESRAVRATAAGGLLNRLTTFMEANFVKTPAQSDGELGVGDYIVLADLHWQIGQDGIVINNVSDLKKMLLETGYTVRQLNRKVNTRDGTGTANVRVANAVMVQQVV